MNRNLFISVATVLLYVGIQCTLNVADARVCFAVGNQKCSDGSYPNNRSVESKNCESLGYVLSCGANQEFDPNAGTCINNEKIYHQCRCNRETYPYTISDISSPYEVAGNVCEDKDGSKHYQYKVCGKDYRYIRTEFMGASSETAGTPFKLVKNISRTSSSTSTCTMANVYKSYQYRPLWMVSTNNATCEDVCIEEDIDTTSGGCPAMASDLSHKYKNCYCDRSKFPYTQTSNHVARGGKIFKFPGGTSCMGSDGVDYWSQKTCSGEFDTQKGGYWKSDCSNDEKSSSVDDVTEEGVTCHLCKKKTCEDYSLYTEAEQCEQNAGIDYTCIEKPAGDNNSLMCYGKQLKTCSNFAFEQGRYYNNGYYAGSNYYSGYYSDYSGEYSDKPIKGYRLKKGNPLGSNISCFIKSEECQVGDYVMEGGYCYTSTADITSEIKSKLSSLGTGTDKKLGIVINVSADGNLRVVADRPSSSDTYTSSKADGTSEANKYKAFSGDTLNWSLPNNTDVEYIINNASVMNKISVNNARRNLFAMRVDEADYDEHGKACSQTWKYAYADIYQCYWVNHNSDSNVQRTIFRKNDIEGKTSFSGIASSDNKWPLYSYNHHIYMRKVAGFNNNYTYQNPVWYVNNDYTDKVDKRFGCYDTHSANSANITLEEILFDRSSNHYIPLTYGARYYVENEDGSMGGKFDVWPKGIQPVRTAIMHAGEKSDPVSRQSVCSGSGSNFKCDMRMYWYGAGTDTFCITEGLRTNGSKEPTEKCFTSLISGEQDHANCTAKWNYVNGTSYFENDGVGCRGIHDFNTTYDAKFYKSGIQGCFVRPVTTITINNQYYYY